MEHERNKTTRLTTPNTEPEGTNPFWPRLNTAPFKPNINLIPFPTQRILEKTPYQNSSISPD